MDPLCGRWTLSHLIPAQLPIRQFLSNPVAGRLSIIVKGTTQNLRLGQPGRWLRIIKKMQRLSDL